jgi:hypothetical protein
MICVSLSLHEGVPWTDSACGGNLPETASTTATGKGGKACEKKETNLAPETMMQHRGKHVACIFHTLSALNLSILRLNAVGKELGKWEISWEIEKIVGIVIK